MALNETLKFVIWVFLGGLMISQLTARQHVSVLGEKRERWSTTAAILLVAPLIYWCAVRGFHFGDTGAYYESFCKAPDSLLELGDYLDTVKKDKGFYAFTVLLKSIIGFDRDLYFGIIATIQMLCIVLVYRKYSRNLWLSIFFFVASTDYTAWMYNGMRQFLAATVCFAAAGLIVKKKYFPAILLCLLASRFHQTALLMLPVMFIVQGKAWNIKTNLILVGAMICVVFVGEFTNILDSAMRDTQYENVVSDWTSGEDDGTNALRVLVYAVPTILAFIWRKRVQEVDNPLINVCVNMSIISTGIYLVSMFTSGIFIGRLPIYMSLYNYILLPWEIRHFFQKDMRMFVTVGAIAFYLMFYLYSYM